MEKLRLPPNKEEISAILVRMIVLSGLAYAIAKVDLNPFFDAAAYAGDTFGEMESIEDVSSSDLLSIEN